MKSGQYRRWISSCGDEVGTVRLVAPIMSNQTRNDATIGCWYVENVATGGSLLLVPEKIGDEVPEMVVIAEAAR